MCEVLNINSFNKKNHNRSGRRVHQIDPFQFHVLFYQHAGSNIWDGSFDSKHNKLFHKLRICLGGVNYRKIYTFIKSLVFCLRVL